MQVQERHCRGARIDCVTSRGHGVRNVVPEMSKGTAEARPSVALPAELAVVRQEHSLGRGYAGGLIAG